MRYWSFKETGHELVSRVLYFDCFSGISGDMALGALLDAGLPLDDLQAALGSLALGGAHVHAERVLRAGVSATKFTCTSSTQRPSATARTPDRRSHPSTRHASRPGEHLATSDRTSTPRSTLMITQHA